MPDVTLEVSAKLDSIEQALSKLSNMGEETKRTFEEMSKSFSKTTVDNSKKVQDQAQKTGGIFKRVLQNMRSDMKALIGIEALQSGLKLSSMFKGSITEAASLGDTIRRVGATFGIASGNFAKFQEMMMKGLGDIGMSSDVAARALEGLSETPVKGEKNLLEYAKTAGMLAKMGGEVGSEGGIAKGMSGVIQSKGGNPNDIRQMNEVADALRRVQISTGKKATEALSAMDEMFGKMSADYRKQMGPKQMAILAAGSMAAGPNATKFMEEYMSKSQFQRSFQSATGGTKLFGKEGFNTDAIKKFYEEAKSLGSGDIRIGLKALGVESDEAAEGFQRLAEHLTEVSAAQERAKNATVDLENSYRSSMGTAESFKANIDKIKGVFAKPFAYAQQGLTGLLQGASKSTLGATAVVAGGGMLAALLTGGGLRGVGKGLFHAGTDEAKLQAKEQLLGEKIQHVWVENAEDIGGGGNHVPGAGEGMGIVGKTLAVAGAGAAGYAAGTAINQIPGVSDAVVEGFNKVAHLFGKGYDKNGMPTKSKVVVELNKRDLKIAKQPTRGASQ
jgi:hypothetical protein